MHRQIHYFKNVLTLVAIMLCTAGSAWGETTYKLVQVTSVEAGKLYVFEQTYNGISYVMSNALTSNSLKTVTDYNTSNLSGTESYVWTLETAQGGFFMKNDKRTADYYLNNAKSSTDLSFGSKSSIWAFNFKDDKTVMIQNTSNDNNFLGFYYGGGEVTTRYKAYKTGSVNESRYPHAIKVYQLVEETPASVNLNGSGYATFASINPLDFSNASDYTAWQITGVSGNVINFQQITGAVAAGTGVFLKGTAGESVEVPFATTGDDISETNKLEGVTTAKDINDNEYYGLSGSSFVKVNAGTVPAGKALLPARVVGEGTQGGNVKALMFVFDHIDGVRSIETVSAEAAAEVFNLAGQRINNRQPGINIINGKKVLVK